MPHITEHLVVGKRLGRHINHDPRSLAYPAPRAPAIRSVVHKSHGLPLDQGQIGSCTANALVGALNCTWNYPRVTTAPFTEAGAVNLYKRETADEGQPYPPNDPGGSGLAVCKAAVELGWIHKYTHALDVDHALQALVLRSVITGINWYTSFDTPAASGLVVISKNATVRGGHEIVANEIDEPNELVWFCNSWGYNYGLGGRFCMSFTTWERLLSEQGDVTVPIP